MLKTSLATKVGSHVSQNKEDP